MTTEPQLTPFQRLKIQMEAIVPVVRALQAELGDEAVMDALRARHAHRVEAAAAQAEANGTHDTPVEVRISGARTSMEIFAEGGVLDYEVVTDEPDALDIDVSSCAYADLMNELGATDLGFLMLCSEDDVMVARAGTRLERTQTRMQGASHCDFRFRADC